MRYNLRLYAITSALFALPLVALAQKGTPKQNELKQHDQPVPVVRVEDQSTERRELDLHLRPRTPIQFTPFEMLDPNTGERVNADDIISVNGVRMTAGEFYRRLNETEQWLNAHGYSLRTDTVFEYYSPQLEMEIDDSERRRQEFEEQMPISGESSDSITEGCRGNRQSFDTGWFGNWLFGTRFEGYGEYNVCFSNIEEALAEVEGNACVHGRLAGIEKRVVTATAQAEVHAENQYLRYRYLVSVNVLGVQAYTLYNAGQFSGQYQQRWELPVIAYWRSHEFSLGCISLFGLPICAYGRVGISGQLRVDASVDVSLFRQNAAIAPTGGLVGFAEAWVGWHLILAQVGAGVRGSVNFFSGSLTGQATGRLVTTSELDGRLCYDYDVRARLHADLTALSGRIEAFVRGCIWFFGWRCAEAKKTLYQWDGLNWRNRSIGEWSNRIRLGCFLPH